ncbi:MAG: single-stranded-DNA-specific exonuclease RecJ [Lentisphaerae bacterium]|nr:single-stranded-DNA-specific exonuclease RecJ [Lentisphaerota bacterium]
MSTAHQESPADRLPLNDWQTTAADPALTASLSSMLELPPPLAALLAARGHTDPAAAARFLAPLDQKLTDPMQIDPVPEAVDRILHAIGRGGRIVVFGDFDADGVVATAVLSDMIGAMGGNVRPFIPDRHTEGYGLTRAALDRCLAEGIPDLLVTVDCGMGATSLLAELHARGVGLVVTDHHTLAGDFPDGCVVVNPRHGAPPAAAGGLCGAGIAFQLACGLVRRRGDRDDERRRLGAWLDAVAIATVADVVPLLGDNRILVACGLRRLNGRPRIGLSELMKKSAVSNIDVGSYHLGFVLGPRLNAAGRMESAEAAYKLLTTTDIDEARQLAILLDNANSLRRQTEEEVLAQAEEQLARWFDNRRHGAVVVGDAGWHPGTVGIVAARLQSRHQRPAAVIVRDGAGGGRGSVRAGQAHNAYDALAACMPHLDRMGGHARAAGFSLKPGAFDAFREAFAAACRDQVGAVAVRPVLVVDGWLAGSDIGQKLLEGIGRLEPFGEGHQPPCWGLRGVVLRNKPIPMGAEGDHLRLALNTADGVPLQGVWFRGARFLPQFPAVGVAFDITGEIVANTYGGQTTPQLVVRDARMRS